jgi:hypothetical protein
LLPGVVAEDRTSAVAVAQVVLYWAMQASLQALRIPLLSVVVGQQEPAAILAVRVPILFLTLLLLLAAVLVAGY